MTASGPKYLDQLGKEADESRTLVEVLCKRVIRPDFDSGKLLSSLPGPAELAEHYAPPSLSQAVREDDRESIRQELIEGFLKRLVRMDEWEEVYQRLHSWQDAMETCSGRYDKSPLSVILSKNPRFPTVDRVKILLGEEMAESYQGALEHMETDPESFAEFPDERVSGGWNRHTAERAVSLVVDVIAPYGNNPEELADAYARYMVELRSRNREKSKTQNVDRLERRRVARSLGIWLPQMADLHQWESDPRTCSRAAEFEKLAMRVVDKMRILRSVLQYIPRRKFSEHTISDLDNNMARMRDYVKDEK